MPNLISPRSALCAFDPDRSDRSAVALRLDFPDFDAEIPRHRHRKGQLVLALRGAVTCTVDDGIWIVPPHHGVWIPGGTPHSNKATENAELSYLFIEPGEADLPEECCTLAVSSVVREMIHRLALESPDYHPDGHGARLARVLLDELVQMPREQLKLPISDHPKILTVAAALTANPADRSTLEAWAQKMAMSERSFARLIAKETGLTFGRWRQQLHLIVALRELASGVSVQHVSGNLGYDSASAFITMFKKALGRTPAQYFARKS